MKNKITAMLTMAAMFAAAVVSCGHDEPEDSTTPDLPSLTTATTTDGESTETTSADVSETTKKTSDTTTTSTETAVTTVKNEDKNKNEDGDSQGDDDQQPDPEPNDQQPEPEPEPEPDPVQQSVTFDFDSMHSDAAAAVAALGDPLDVQTAPACFSNGADSKIYEYDGLRIECYVINGGEYICAVTITGGDHATTSGIKIGSSRSDVESAYGAGENFGDSVLYRNGNDELTVYYSGDSVTKIDFYAPVG